jgi:hypothetical protein
MIKECSAERYDEMLGVLPPALWLANRFLVGEPADHRRCKINNKILPTYSLLDDSRALPSPCCAYGVKAIEGNEQLSCSELTGIRA